MNRMDRYVEALFQVLPAASYDDIRRGMQRELGRGYNVTHDTVCHTLAHLRRNTEAWGWTVPHAKRGKLALGDTRKRFFAVLVERDGSFILDEEHRDHLADGSSATMQTVATQSKNLETALRLCIPYERSAARRDIMNDLLETISYVARRSARVVKQINNKMRAA